MNYAVKTILVPVEITTNYLSFAKQAAELAKQHGAEIHLLHIADIGACRLSNFPWFVSPRVLSNLVKEKTSLLDTWERWIENDYSIKVTTTVDFGRKQKGILQYASKIKADLIALLQEPTKKKWFSLWPSPVEQIIKRSPCQVITFFSDKNSIAEWKQVVIPVTDFIPELRIRTIIDTAKIFKLKIHLVTIPTGNLDNQRADFYFLTETLKRLKPAGNVQVECCCLETGNSPVASFLKYTKSVGADILMTNMKFVDSESRRIKDMNFFLEY